MSFYTEVIRHDPRFKLNSPCRDMTLLEPVTRAAVLAIVADAKAQGHDVRVMETFRSQARQAYVYSQGFSHLKNVGVHNFGLACDLGVYVNGNYEDDGDPYYKFLLPLCRKHGLVSGQDWGRPDIKHSFIDWGHVQRCTVQKQGALFRGEWYPDATYNPYDDLKAQGVATPHAAAPATGHAARVAAAAAKRPGRPRRAT